MVDVFPACFSLLDVSSSKRQCAPESALEVLRVVRRHMDHPLLMPAHVKISDKRKKAIKRRWELGDAMERLFLLCRKDGKTLRVTHILCAVVLLCFGFWRH